MTDFPSPSEAAMPSLSRPDLDALAETGASMGGEDLRRETPLL